MNLNLILKNIINNGNIIYELPRNEEIENELFISIIIPKKKKNNKTFQ